MRKGTKGKGGLKEGENLQKRGLCRCPLRVLGSKGGRAERRSNSQVPGFWSWQWKEISINDKRGFSLHWAFKEFTASLNPISSTYTPERGWYKAKPNRMKEEKGRRNGAGAGRGSVIAIASIPCPTISSATVLRSLDLYFLPALLPSCRPPTDSQQARRTPNCQPHTIINFPPNSPR